MIMQPMLPLGDLNVASRTVLTGAAAELVVLVVERLLVVERVLVVVDDAVAGVEAEAPVVGVTVTVLVELDPHPATTRADTADVRRIRRNTECSLLGHSFQVDGPRVG
jgi:hypothetical protein